MAYRKYKANNGWGIFKTVVFTILAIGLAYVFANLIYCACVGVTFPTAVETFFGLIEQAVETVTPPIEEGATAVFKMIV